MLHPPDTLLQSPVERGATAEPHPGKTPRRPALWVLGLTYLAWIGFIAAVMRMPDRLPFGIIAFVMVVFIWLPLWAYRHWTDVASDWPSTWTIIGMAVLATFAMQVDHWWEESEVRDVLRQLIVTTYFPAKPVWYTPWPAKVIDALPECLLFGIVLCWGVVRERISKRFTLESPDQKTRMTPEPRSERPTS
jgi:hypothetical protein